MSEPKTIDVETVTTPAQPSAPTQALAIRAPEGEAVDKAMTVDELKANLAFIKEVMQGVMKEGQDYGKIPGTGDKPSLLQPGAQKLCMVFKLTDSVKEEKCVDLPGYHREYSFVVTLTSATGRSWDGVGTCSTLESKYRYRKAERRCPMCGKNKIIQGKAEWGGGWLCFKKKGGCGAKFVENDERITRQSAETVEYENPPDYWNTVRKMAFKRALVHASINATNTSELWTQDVEEMAQNAEAAPKPTAPSKPASKAASKPAPKPAAKPTGVRVATTAFRTVMIKRLEIGPGQKYRAIATEYFRKVGPPNMLLPNEEIEDLQLRFVPVNPEQLELMRNCILNFEAGGDPVVPYPPNDQAEPPKPNGGTKGSNSTPTASPTQTGTTAQTATPASATANDPEWWRDIIVPIPHKGQKKDDYLKNPDTIGSLYDQRHGQDEESQAARQRLFGFVHHWEPTGWDKRDGTHVPPSAADLKFREALDAFADWFEREHPEEQL